MKFKFKSWILEQILRFNLFYLESLESRGFCITVMKLVSVMEA